MRKVVTNIPSLSTPLVLPSQASGIISLAVSQRKTSGKKYTVCWWCKTTGLLWWSGRWFWLTIATHFTSRALALSHGP
ncbi:hypothetical protein BDDG_13654 [Blastomyces dermatitidis ATCC 18188]|uniref:Uncharacterized protein n=1 Tax=Ajellomyces dermatitidis (strain ATCC 18188 / CBS 674.68) TaxID=653446 RepID=A0A0J9ETA7_AJEDA|nr:hypothetical protein BDDG_13654 [Blastomyces dermatitidis ATCC 18188]